MSIVVILTQRNQNVVGETSKVSVSYHLSKWRHKKVITGDKCQTFTAE